MLNKSITLINLLWQDNINKTWKILKHLLNSEQNSKQSITEINVSKLVIINNTIIVYDRA